MRNFQRFGILLVIGCFIMLIFSVIFKPNLRDYLTVSPTPKLALESSKPHEADIGFVKGLVEAGRPLEAIHIIAKHLDDIESGSEQGKQWLDVLVRASADAHNASQLMQIYTFDPQAITHNEHAALIVADQLIQEGKTTDYYALRNTIYHASFERDKWFILDADALIQDKKIPEAIALLQSRVLDGSKDTPRLVRLSLLHIADQPKSAWNYLSEAHKKDPSNKDILSYRARLLETAGKPQLALVEYLGAAAKDPVNPDLKDQLADFHIRNKQYDEALKVLFENLEAPSSGSIWLKALFWNKVVSSITANWASLSVPQGSLNPLLHYLLGLTPGKFWDEQTFNNQGDLASFLKTEQATFWLRLIEALKTGQEQHALQMIQSNPFTKESWAPALLSGIQSVLTFRQNGAFTPPNTSPTPDTSIEEMTEANDYPDIFKQLIQLARAPSNDAKESANLSEFIKSPEVFSALFIAAGWREAGLALHKTRILPPTTPRWVAENMTKALQTNRGIADALKFATLQKKNPGLSLQIAELYILSGSADAGLAELKDLNATPGSVGDKATLLLSKVLMDRKNLSEAKTLIKERTQLAESVVGEEALARIALIEGDNAAAEEIYTKIEKSSVEAKSYLARKAFASKDWSRAKELTEALLKQYPKSQVLKDNLQKIINEQKGTHE